MHGTTSVQTNTPGIVSMPHETLARTAPHCVMHRLCYTKHCAPAGDNIAAHAMHNAPATRLRQPTPRAATQLSGATRGGAANTRSTLAAPYSTARQVQAVL